MSLREGVDRMVDRATLAIGLDPDTAKVVQACNMVAQIKFPAKVRGKVEVFTGWWAIHSAHRLPAKGGLRFAPIINQEEIEGLAALMSYKCAIADATASGWRKNSCKAYWTPFPVASVRPAMPPRFVGLPVTQAS